MRTTTSLAVTEFDGLSSGLRVRSPPSGHHVADSARRRAQGVSQVTAQQKLSFVPLYFQTYLTQDVMALPFGITRCLE